MDVYAKVFTDKNPSGKHLLLHLSDNPFDPENVNKIRTAVESVGIVDPQYIVKYSTKDRSIFAVFCSNNDTYLYTVSAGNEKRLIEGDSNGFTVTEGLNKTTHETMFSLLTMDEVFPLVGGNEVH